MGMLDFLRGGRNAQAKSRGRSARATHRRPWLEPLEERALLSVTTQVEQTLASYAWQSGVAGIAVDSPSAVVEAGDIAADATGVALSIQSEPWIDDSFRVAVWTPEMITDLPGWAHSQQWPEWMGEFGQFWVEGQSMDEMEPNRIHELVHMPLWSDARGGYRTILQIEGAFRGVVDEMLADLEELDFVDDAKLESQSLFRFTDRLQESIDAITDGNSQEQVFIDDPVVVGPGELFIDEPVVVAPGELFIDEPVVVEQAALDEAVRLTVWTPERIADVGDWVESQTWPDAMYMDRHLVKELVHMPVRSEPRGGYFTILKITPITQLSAEEALAALEQLDFIENARLESKCVVQYGPRAQELIDNTTMDGASGEANLFGGDDSSQSK